MKQLTTHPYMDSRTVKAFETENGKYVQVYDVRDLYNGNYSVEVDDGRGGMTMVYARSSVEKCMTYIQSHFD